MTLMFSFILINKLRKSEGSAFHAWCIWDKTGSSEGFSKLNMGNKLELTVSLKTIGVKIRLDL